MKNKWNKIATLSLIFATIALFSCEEIDDSKKEWGYALIYMPQASILNGGISNDYPVPLSNASSKNYLLDEEKQLLYINLGVYRSGLQPLESYTVRVAADDAASTAAANRLDHGLVLPKDMYEMPDKITVPDGQRERTFYMTVDLSALRPRLRELEKIRQEETGERFICNNIALVVSLFDNTKYELNPDLAKTTVVIDRHFFLPILSVTGVTLDRSTLLLNLGEKVTLKADVAPAFADNKDVKWSSSAPSVVSVSDYGEVTALKTGFATITATTDDGGRTATCVVWIPASSFDDSNNLLLNPGFTIQGDDKQKALYWTQPTDAWYTTFYDKNKGDPYGPGTRRTGSWQRNAQNTWPFNTAEGGFFNSYITEGWATMISPGMAGGLYQEVSVTPGKMYGFSVFLGLCEVNAWNKFKDFETIKILSAGDGLTAYHLEPIVIDPVKIFMYNGHRAIVTTVRGFVKIPDGVTKIRFQFDQRSFDTVNLTGGGVGDSPGFVVDHCVFIPLE